MDGSEWRCSLVNVDGRQCDSVCNFEHVGNAVAVSNAGSVAVAVFCECDARVAVVSGEHWCSWGRVCV